MNTRSVEPRWGHAVRVWWSFSWRWPLLMLIPLLPVALAAALAKHYGYLSAHGAQRLASFVSFPMAFWAQIVAVRMILKTDFKSFHLKVHERAAHE